MTKVVYLASPEGKVGKSVIALGLVDALAAETKSVGVFRPLVRSLRRDKVTETMLDLPGVRQNYDEAIGVTYDEMASDPVSAMRVIMRKYEKIHDKYDSIVVVGSDYAGVFSPRELQFNAEIAANMDAPVLLVVNALSHGEDNVLKSAEIAIQEFTRQHTRVMGVIANQVDPRRLNQVRTDLKELGPEYVTGAIPRSTVLSAPTVRQQFEATRAALWQGDAKLLERESLGIVVAGMELPNVLDRIEPEMTVVVPSDRLDLLPGLIMAHNSSTFTQLAGIILVGGYPVPSTINKLVADLAVDLPIGFTSTGTYETAQKLFGLQGTMTSSARKIDLARRTLSEHVDVRSITNAISLKREPILTPLMFEFQLMARARKNKKTIVLPEASDERIIESAAILQSRDVANLILLGDEAEVRHRAHLLGHDISQVQVVSPHNRQLIEQFAEEYARLRAHKGVTLDQAREKLTDLSYFGTMLVHLGLADGMVSGAINTTANTIKPSLEFIKTRPGTNVVSSSFLMCMPEQVVVYGDCAVNPNPTAEQLADIAISSAETAAAFGIDPRVAMLSYSTGASGNGPDVDLVREATEMVKQRKPQLKIDGPLQFDAAIDPVVGAKKMPGSEVAGQATVFIFPDLNSGNNTYKAVQRTSGAVAIGPVLQGLNKPVNDLSRGALVDDIVNTVAITAIQAQMEEARLAEEAKRPDPAKARRLGRIEWPPRPDDLARSPETIDDPVTGDGGSTPDVDPRLA